MRVRLIDQSKPEGFEVPIERDGEVFVVHVLPGEDLECDESMAAGFLVQSDRWGPVDAAGEALQREAIEAWTAHRRTPTEGVIEALTAKPDGGTPRFYEEPPVPAAEFNEEGK